MATEQDQAFVQYVLQAIVDHPDEVKVDRTIDEMGVLISVSVNPEDMGKVIGKSGQTAKAVRTLLKVVGAKNDARVNMKIIEPEGDQSAAAAQPGTTDAADDVPADTADTSEAAQEQWGTDAAQDQPSENNSSVDEATGEAQPAEPVAAADGEDTQSTDDPAPEEPQAAEQPKRNPLNEKSPLDEL